MTTASASATAQGVWQGAWSAGANASAIFANNGTLDLLSVKATAGAVASFFAFASASATGISQGAWAAGSSVLASVQNAGNIFVGAFASAIAGTSAIASASAFGIWQGAWAAGANASAVVLNSGDISVIATALAFGGTWASASASATGISQSVWAAGSTARASVFNSGNIVVSAFALAVAGSFATAWANASGITQSAWSAPLASAFVANTTSGLLSVHATASAVAGSSAFASAWVTGISQWAVGSTSARAIVANAGVIDVGAFAFASASLASAFASAWGIVQTAVAPTFALASVSNASGALISVHATATAIAFFGTALASAAALGISQNVTASSLAIARVVNSGTILPACNALALAPGGAAFAFAAPCTEINQFVNAGGAVGLAQVFNNGVIVASANATAKAAFTAVAFASAAAIVQSVTNASFASAWVTNAAGATISALAHADAHGVIAIATALARGISQFVSVTPGVVALGFNNVTNSGLVNVQATASAHGGFDVPVALALGVLQSAATGGGGATLLSNDVFNAVGATINVSAHAFASAGNIAGFPATQFAGALGIVQAISGFGTFASNGVTNSGLLHVSASAVGTGGQWAFVGASAVGIAQLVGGGGAGFAFVNNSVVNNGQITVLANASASASQDAFFAVAFASATGVFQFAWGTTFASETNSFTNNSSLDVRAHANANAVTTPAGVFSSAFASARAVGVTQSFWGATSGVAWSTAINNGSLNVQATATANGLAATAVAFATGVAAWASITPLFLGLNIVNNGTFHVEANAAGNGFGFASANGVWASGNFVFGTVANNGAMTVVADAGGAASGSAWALGMGVWASTFAGVVSNAGDLDVRAITGTGGGFLTAVGILVAGPACPPTTAGFFTCQTAVGTVINAGGSIFAGISLDDGDTFFRGTAIAVAGAPNAMSVILSGAGNGTSAGGDIYGNIYISTDDSITVVNGNTYFNGVVNQPFTSAFVAGSTVFMPYPLTAPFLPSLITSAGGIDPFVSAWAVGALSITAAGTLVLGNDPKQGAAAAYVSNYAQSGALVMQIRGTTPNTPQGGDNTVGKIVASVSATIGGSLEIIPFAGLYTDTSYAIVSAPAGSLVGTWTSISDPSVLLNFTVTNSPGVFVDRKILNVDRLAFDSVPGLTKNLAAVAGSIEDTYSTALTGAYADLVAKLFQIGSAAEFADAMRQLSGVEYGLLAKASLTSVRMLNNTVGTHLQVVSAGGSDHVAQLIKGIEPAKGGTGIGKGNIWLSAWGNWGDLDAQSSNPAYNTSEHGILIGVDFEMDNDTLFGVVGGQSSGKVNFEKDYHNSGDYDGWHLGVYGRYDDARHPWYVEGIASYSMYTNDVRRNIFIDPSVQPLHTFGFTEPSSDIFGRAHGSYDAHTYAFRAEAGWNMDTGSAIDLTPFVALHWMRNGSDSFDEKGFAGGNLHISDASADSFASHLGLRLTTDWHMTETVVFSPVLRIAWEHEFEDEHWDVHASFAGAPAGGGFHTTGDGYADDFLNVGAAAAFAISGRVDAVIGYEGHFSSDEHHSAVTGRVNLRW
ncbi:MAG: autotransporter domain-containing protein [Alphaproteobacteria bacterium]